MVAQVGPDPHVESQPRAARTPPPAERPDDLEAAAGRLRRRQHPGERHLVDFRVGSCLTVRTRL